MATPNAQIALHLEAAPTYQRLPPNLRREWVTKVNSFPSHWLTKPASGERFESPANCLERLNAYGFFEGCLFVSGRQRPDGTPNFQYLCKFHSFTTANKWHLEERVVRDEQGEIQTTRKKDTQNKRKGCPVQYVLAFKIVDFVTKERAYIGRWKEETHQHHELYLNPFSFHAHKQSTEAHQQLTAQARKYRVAQQSYSKACQLLREEGSGLVLDQRTYYNLVRHQKFDKEKDKTVEGLLNALDEEGFLHRHRTEKVVEGLDEDERVIGRKLIQIFFWSKNAEILAQRWVAGHALVIDATFNTNALQLPLMVAVGVTNENKTFPIAFSYCPSESAESFVFFLESLRTVFFQNTPEPAVVLSDLAAGMISAFDIHKAMPRSVLQFCSWHAAEAIKKKIRRAGRYTEKEIEGWEDKAVGVKHKGLKHYIWDYIQSETEEELERNRTTFLNALQPIEQRYIDDNYVPKELRFVTCHTRKLKNLGQNATQRVESYHRVIHGVTHGKLSLEASAKALCAKINEIYIQLATAEDQAALNQFTALDINVFRLLIGSVSLFAIKQVQGEWFGMRNQLRENQQLGQCGSCDILLRYSLPCRHYLQPLWDSGASIPRSLLHPRWWLRGPTAIEGVWIPSINQQLARPASPRQYNVDSVLHALREARDELTGDEQARFDDQIFSTARALQASARDKLAIAKLPILNPDAIQKKQWRRVKPTANSRALTGAQIAAADTKKAEKERKQAEKDAEILAKRQQVSGFQRYKYRLI